MLYHLLWIVGQTGVPQPRFPGFDYGVLNVTLDTAPPPPAIAKDR